MVADPRPPSLQDAFPSILCRQSIPVSIYLVNGIKLQGQIEAFDAYVVMLKSAVTQSIYKHAISTSAPVRPLRYSQAGSGQ